MNLTVYRLVAQMLCQAFERKLFRKKEGVAEWELSPAQQLDSEDFERMVIGIIFRGKSEGKLVGVFPEEYKYKIAANIPAGMPEQLSRTLKTLLLADLYGEPGGNN